MIQNLFNKDDIVSVPKLIGISGTSGKTITAHLLYHILKVSGKRVGIISTNGSEFEGDINSESINIIKRNDFRKRLNQMFHKGAEFAVVEVSVDNLKKGIYKGLTFDSEIVTNIMGDPNYGTWDNYSKYILGFINQVRDNGIIVLNADESDTRVWLSHNSDNIEPNIYVYWASSGNIHSKSFSLAGSQLHIGGIAQLKTSLLGHFNAINVYQAAKLALHYVTIENVIKGMQTYASPKGRLDKIYTDPFTVLIDYGNDPKHIYDALSFLKAAKNPASRLITVAGPKGNQKDIDYHIGSIATDLSDAVLITSNDPVKEDIKKINQKTINHAFERGGNLLHSFDTSQQILDIPIQTVIKNMHNIASHALTPILSFNQNDFKGRLDAIAFAFQIAAPGDVLYISGKGHENSIHYKDVEYEWSDYEAARIAMDSLLGRR